MAHGHSYHHMGRAKPLFPSLQPHEPSVIPDATKGSVHRRRAVRIVVMALVVAIVAVTGYYLLLLHKQLS